MGRPRKFDWDEAIRLRAEDPERWTYPVLADHFGVVPRTIYLVLNPAAREADNARTTEWQRGGVCEVCGAQCSRTRGRRQRCASCFNDSQATSVRGGELQCVSCRRWLPDKCFPRSRNNPRRRGRHASCSACLTKARRAYREARKVPCEGGCGRLVHTDSVSRKPGDPALCQPCWHRRRRRTAA